MGIVFYFKIFTWVLWGFWWGENIWLTLFALKLDGHDNVIVLVIQSESPLTIGLVGDVIWIIDDLPEVLSCEGLCIKSLARDISYWDENTVPIFGVRDLKRWSWLHKEKYLRLGQAQVVSRLWQCPFLKRYCEMLFSPLRSQNKPIELIDPRRSLDQQILFQSWLWISAYWKKLSF